MNVKKSILLRVRIAFLAMLAVSVLSVARMAYLQMVQGKRWEKRFAERDIRFRKIPAMRGNIYASDGSLLATSLPYYRVAIDPTLPNDEDFKKFFSRPTRFLLQKTHYRGS